MGVHFLHDNALQDTSNGLLPVEPFSFLWIDLASQGWVAKDYTEASCIFKSTEKIYTVVHFYCMCDPV